MTLEIDSQEQNAHPAPARTPWNGAIARGDRKQMQRLETPTGHFTSRKQESGD